MWYYKDKKYENIHDESLFGFIYLITHIPTGKMYIGKKNFYSKRTVKKGKKELSEMKDKRGSKKKKVVKESDWKTYKSSNSFLKEQPEGHLRKEILMFCKTAQDLTYYETKLQFVHEVLESEMWLNGNILSKFFNRY